MTALTPLMKKLRLDADKRMLLVNAPETFEAALGGDLSALNLQSGFEEGLEFVLIFAHYQRQILEVMREMNREEKTTFIFSTHDENVLQYASDIIKIKDGLIEEE